MKKKRLQVDVYTVCLVLAAIFLLGANLLLYTELAQYTTWSVAKW